MRRGAGDEGRSRPRPFVGRAREVELANGCLDDALAGHGGALLLAGDPGIGKTRLAELVETRAASLGVPTMWGRCVEEEGAPAFWPWRQVLRSCVEPSAGGDVGDLAALVPDLRASNEPGKQRPVAAPVGGEERFRLFETVTRTLIDAAVPAGLVVVLDDLHWADPSSAWLLAHVGRDLAASRLLLVATYRDREVDSDHPVAAALASIARERGTVRLRLEGLADVEVADQLEATFGRRFDVDVVARVARRTQGNPFFVGEIGALLDRVAGTGGVTAEAWATGLPEGVRALIAQRLDRLPRECGDVLRTAAVVGATIDLRAIAALRGSTTTVVLTELDAAVQAGLVVATDGFEFAHSLVRDTLVGQVSTVRRLEIHARVAEHLESTYADDLNRHAAQLAHHWLSALPTGDARHAVDWAERAAADARSHLAYEEAARLYQRALDAVVASEGFGAEDRCRLLVQLAEAHFKSGDVNSAIRAAAEAGEEAEHIGDPMAMAGAALVLEGVSDEAWGRRVVELCDKALARFGDDHAELRARLMAATAAASSSATVDDGPDRAEPLSRQALTLAESTGSPAALVSALRARQMACAGPDGVGDRLEVADRMLRLAADTSDAWAALWGRLWRIDAQCQLGDVDGADADAVFVDEAAARLRQPVADWHLARTRCTLAMVRGRFAEAASHLDQVAALGTRGIDARGHIVHWIAGAKLGALTGDSRYEHYIAMLAADDTPLSAMAASTVLALSYAESGDLERAREQYRRLPPVSGWRVPRFVALVALEQRARVAATLGDVDGAAAAYERLGRWSAYFAVGGSGLVAMHGSVEYALGRLAACVGKSDRAVRHLRAAVAANSGAGLPPFDIESRCELAHVLAHRGRPEDLSEALVLAGDAARAAAELGMRPVQARSERLIQSLQASGQPRVTRRELEIAALVARGLTNRQIADMLHIAERTAENHVQHILTKLGFERRSQIASWATDQHRHQAVTFPDAR